MFYLVILMITYNGRLIEVIKYTNKISFLSPIVISFTYRK